MNVLIDLRLNSTEIVYAMPLRGDGKRRSDTTDSGCDTTDTTSSSILADVSNQGDKFVDGQGDKFADGTVNEDEEPQDKWMLDMGFEHNMIKSISSSQVFNCTLTVYNFNQSSNCLKQKKIII